MFNFSLNTIVTSKCQQLQMSFKLLRCCILTIFVLKYKKKGWYKMFLITGTGKYLVKEFLVMLSLVNPHYHTLTYLKSTIFVKEATIKISSYTFIPECCGKGYWCMIFQCFYVFFLLKAFQSRKVLTYDIIFSETFPVRNGVDIWYFVNGISIQQPSTNQKYKMSQISVC